MIGRRSRKHLMHSFSTLISNASTSKLLFKNLFTVQAIYYLFSVKAKTMPFALRNIKTNPVNKCKQNVA